MRGFLDFLPDLRPSYFSLLPSVFPLKLGIFPFDRLQHDPDPGDPLVDLKTWRVEPKSSNRTAKHNSGFSLVWSGSRHRYLFDMDPLSVGASVIAVVGATGKVVKGIRRLKAMQDAPRELDDLLTEVSQFELVVKASEKVNGRIESELGTLLKTAQGLIIELESLIEYKLTEPGSSNKVDRWQWIRSSKDVERLRVKLRDVTANLVALVGVNTRYAFL